MIFAKLTQTSLWQKPHMYPIRSSRPKNESGQLLKVTWTQETNCKKILYLAWKSVFGCINILKFNFTFGQTENLYFHHFSFFYVFADFHVTKVWVMKKLYISCYSCPKSKKKSFLNVLKQKKKHHLFGKIFLTATKKVYFGDKKVTFFPWFLKNLVFTT